MISVDVEAGRGAFALEAKFESDARLIGLFGPSGSGKTTLIHLIAGLVRPARGHIEIDGTTLFDSVRDIDMPVRRRRVGLVYQDSLLFPHMSVRQNLLFGHFFTPEAERRIPFESVLQTLGINALLNRRPGTLSGGERQRVALARALLASPRILLLDEPLASLDFDRKVEIMGLIERLRDEYRIPIVYVSHAIEEVSRLAGYVVVLRAGKVVGAGPPSEALSQMNRATHADRFEIVSIVDCQVSGFDAEFEMTTLRHPAGPIFIAGEVGPENKSVLVVIGATDVALAKSRPDNLSIRTVLSGEVAAVHSEIGAACTVDISLQGGGRLAASVTRLAIRELELAPGTRVYALIKAVAIDERPFHSR
ncbi:MAG: molybdenum ABC transporter ATP-binding protein [Methylobacteriaceae bacterium]|nr:molybdenum ABC transporter ATP-binding protein [Methylobacteriaceae bacterium]